MLFCSFGRTSRKGAIRWNGALSPSDSIASLGLQALMESVAMSLHLAGWWAGAFSTLLGSPAPVPRKRSCSANVGLKLSAHSKVLGHASPAKALASLCPCCGSTYHSGPGAPTCSSRHLSLEVALLASDCWHWLSSFPRPNGTALAGLSCLGCRHCHCWPAAQAMQPLPVSE